MKPFLVLMLLSILTACGLPGEQAKPVVFTPLKCDGNICIHSLAATISKSGAALTLQFDLVDPSDKVVVGDEPSLADGSEPDLVGIFDTSDTYLWGGKVPASYYVCYAGNDIPGSAGQLASICALELPGNQMQKHVAAGDSILVDMDRFAIHDRVPVTLEEKST